MSYETILYDTDGATATITLNRPHRLNSMVPQMLDDLDAAVREANRDPAVKVVILRGAGRAFSAGFDFGQDFSTGYGTILYTDGKWDPGKDMIGTTDGLTAGMSRRLLN
jgi:enoyl-CoA hydratase